MKSSGGIGKSNLHAGMVNRSPKAPSKDPSGPNVAADATRSKIGRGHTLGGRTA